MVMTKMSNFYNKHRQTIVCVLALRFSKYSHNCNFHISTENEKIHLLKKSLERIKNQLEEGDVFLANYEIECLIYALDMEIENPDLVEKLEQQGYEQ